MYSRQNNNNPIARRVVLAALLLVALFYWGMQGKSNRSVSVTGQNGTAQRAQPAVNPIANLLAGAPAPELDGVAISLLIDTSGSMAEAVPDGPGKTSRKIDIAKRSAMSFIRQCQAYTAKNAAKRVLLGVYQFSSLGEGHPLTRAVANFGPPDAGAASPKVSAMVASGGTPIGDAMISAYRDLAASRVTRKFILVVTDGENNQGYQPGDVAEVLGRLASEQRPAIYFIAFDTKAEQFKPVADAGGLVMSAGDAPALEAALDYLLSGKILAEQPEPTSR